jgi:arylformamidase
MRRQEKMETAREHTDKTTYYTVRHPEEFKIDWRAFYDRADELAGEARKNLAHVLNLAYGSNPKQMVDLYLPKTTDRRCPVFVFLHGGRFREGDRAHYGYVATPLAGHNVISAIASYRLTPDYHYPDQVEDVEQLLAWVVRNIKGYGGDPGLIYMGGHSAGAVLSAFVSLRTGWRRRLSLPLDLIRGFAAIGAPSFDLRKGNWVDEYLPDPNQRSEASPLLNIETVPPRAVVATSFFKDKAGGQEAVTASEEMVQKMREKGSLVELVLLEDMDHSKMVLSLGDEQSKLAKVILNMITI